MKRITTTLLAIMVGAGLMSSAYAADLIIEEPVEVGVIDVSGDWEGPYIGVFAGAGWGLADMTDPGAGPCSVAPLEGCDVDLSGWAVGVKAGANFNVSESILAGIVADIAWSDISGSDDFAVIGESENTINWQGSLRGVLGFDGGAFMPYVTGGLAIANASHFAEIALGDIPTVDVTHIGWTVGAGVSFAATEDLSVNLEYRYSDFGAQEYDHDTGFPPPEFALTQHLVTVGLNWQF